MEVDDDEFPSSPTNSSPSSSDLDTESTGSFFHDRSTTLGTLMGVTLNPNPTSSRSIRPQPPPISTAPQLTTPASHRIKRRRLRRRARSGWWRLCRDDTAGPTKLGEFLEVERRINNAGDLIEAEICYGGGGGGEMVPREEGRLFENGRVLPPPANGMMIERRKKNAEVSSLVRLPVLLTGICSGGER